MTTIYHALTAIAMLAIAVIYGTDVFCAMVQRSALARVSDETLASVMGFVHLYGDRRLPLPGVAGLVATHCWPRSPPCFKTPLPQGLALAALMVGVMST